jgi:adenylylsulfate kinase-like enzyme
MRSRSGRVTFRARAVDRSGANGGRPIDGSSGCLVISGVPGAGKTTVAGLVADSLPRSAVPDADDLARMVRSGWVGPIGEPADEARAQLMLRTRNVCLLAGSFAEAGFFPVIDHVVADREMLEASGFTGH